MKHQHVRERVIHAVLQRQVSKFGNRTFLFFKDQEYGYRDFDEASSRVARGLQRLGIGKGDKIAILMSNRPEFLFLWFGISKAGAIEVAINTNHKGDLLQYFMVHSDARILVVENQFLDQVGQVIAGAPQIEKVLVLGYGAQSVPSLGLPKYDFAEIIDNEGDYEPVDVLWSDPFGIMYTSGTTGASKGALMPHNYALHMGEFCIKAIEYDESDCLYNALPLFHGNAQLLSFMPALMSGARTVLAERFSASAFWDDIRRYGCTAFNGIGGIVPILFKAEPRVDDADHPLKKIFTAATPKDVHEAFEKRFGVKILEGYGMNEIGIPLVNRFSENRPGSCGKLLPGYDVRIADDEGNALGPGEVGEFLIRPLKPYAMMLEYYKMPAQTVDAWRDLWFHTGDSGYFDESGYYYFADRKKDALRRRGENISSFEVERVINTHPAVLESAAVAVQSDLGEDEVMVCLTLRPGQALDPQALIAFCEERMAYFMVPRYLRILEKLPKTPTERIRKAELRKEGIAPGTWDRETAGGREKR